MIIYPLFFPNFCHWFAFVLFIEFKSIKMHEFIITCSIILNLPMKPNFTSKTLDYARYVVKTMDNGESYKLQYRSLAKVGDDSTSV